MSVVPIDLRVRSLRHRVRARISSWVLEACLYLARHLHSRNAAMRFAYESGQEGQGGRWYDAWRTARFAVACDPTYSDGHRMLGWAAVHLGWLDYARKAYDRGLGMAPSANLYWARGDLAMDSKAYDEAENAYRAGARLAPDDPVLELKIAEALLAQQRTEEAVPVMNDVLRRHPEDGPALELLGSTALWRGDWAQAEMLLRRAQAAGIDAGMLHYRQAIARRHLGRMEQAQESARRAVERDPENTRFHALVEELSWASFEPKTPQSPS